MCNRSFSRSLLSVFGSLLPRHNAVCGPFIMRFAFVDSLAAFNALTLTVFCCIQAAFLSVLLSPSLTKLAPLRSYMLLIYAHFFIFLFTYISHVLVLSDSSNQSIVNLSTTLFWCNSARKYHKSARECNGKSVIVVARTGVF